MDKKKLFALASFTAITGIMVATTAAGCSSSSSTTTTPDAGKDVKTSPPPVTPPPTDDGGGDSGSGNGCPPTTPVDAASLPWEDPAAPTLAACAEKDITAMVGAVKAGSVKTDDDLKAVLTGGAAGACSKCIFTDASKAPWGPLPEVNDPKAGPQAVTVNVGGCYALGLNNKTCGKALQNLQDCKFNVCFDTACPANPTSTQLQNCFTAAEKGACKAIAASIQTACTGVTQQQLDATATDCEPDTRPDGTKTEYTFEGPVRVQCVRGLVGEAG
jgi:hypothetical protein